MLGVIEAVHWFPRVFFLSRRIKERVEARSARSARRILIVWVCLTKTDANRQRSRPQSGVEIFIFKFENRSKQKVKRTQIGVEMF